MLMFILKCLYRFLDDDFEGFEPENIKGLKLGVKWETLFWSGSLSQKMVVFMKFLQDLIQCFRDLPIGLDPKRFKMEL